MCFVIVAPLGRLARNLINNEMMNDIRNEIWPKVPKVVIHYFQFKSQESEKFLHLIFHSKMQKNVGLRMRMQSSHTLGPAWKTCIHSQL